MQGRRGIRAMQAKKKNAGQCFRKLNEQLLKENNIFIWFTCTKGGVIGENKGLAATEKIKQ